MPLHREITDAIASDIATGRLETGERLPAQRELADRLGVSLGTVTRAYAVAERRGLIHGETGRGTFVGARSEHMSFDSSAKNDADPSQLDVSWPLYAHDPDLAQALTRVAGSKICRRLLRYQPNAGMPHHRDAGAEWARRYRLQPDPAQVLICAGTQHALCVALTAATEPGDTVFCDALTYPGFRALARLLHVNVVGIPMDRHGMIPDALDAACRLRRGRVLYTIPTIQNPTTATLSENRRRDIALVAERHGMMILEDAVHHLLAESPPPAFGAIAPERTLFVASMSKVVTGGLRVAFLVAPPAWVERLAHGIWATQWMAAPLCAEVAAGWIHDGTADNVVRRKRNEARARLEMLLAGLDEHRISFERGGYHVWLELPDSWDASRFASEARRRGAAVSTADAFAVGPEEPPRAVRISLSAPLTRGALAAGVETLRDILRGEPEAGPAIV